jgi:hypothetical protein
VPTQDLGEMVMERLKARDHIAYVRFASVYRNFQDLTEFYEELRVLDERSAQLEVRRYQRELPLGANGESQIAEGPPPAQSEDAAEEASVRR